MIYILASQSTVSTNTMCTPHIEPGADMGISHDIALWADNGSGELIDITVFCVRLINE
jgi:hypothetical protein